MPYEIVKKGDKYCVVKQDGGKEIGCHPSEKEAKDQMSAIYANENKELHITPKSAGFFSKVKSGLVVLKGRDGLRFMLMITTNAYPDREKETIASKALQEYVDHAWRVEDKCLPDNPLLFWHKSDPIGDIVWTKMQGPFLLEVAKERPNKKIRIKGDKWIWETTIKTLWDVIEKDERYKWGASHGFRYPDDEFKNGVYERIRKFESSTLPLPAAANLLTFSGVVKEMDTDKVLEDLFSRAGILNSPDIVKRFLKGADELKKAADNIGLESKAFEDNKTKGIMDKLMVAIEAFLAKVSDNADPALKDQLLQSIVGAMASGATNEPDGDAMSTAYESTPAPTAKPGEDDTGVTGKQAKAWSAVTKALETLTENDIEVAKALKEVTEVIRPLQNLPTSVETLSSTVKGLQTEVEAIKTRLNGAPRRASADPATEVKDAELVAAAKKALDKVEELFPGSGVHVRALPPQNGKGA